MKSSEFINMRKSFLLLIVVILIVNILLLFFIYNEYKMQDNNLKFTSNIIKLSNNAIIELQSTENSQRGFLLTTEDVYLENYEKHKLMANAFMDELFVKLGNNMNDYTSLKKVKLYKRITFNKLKSAIELTKSGQFDYVAYSMIQDYGNEYIDKIKNNLNKFIKIKEEDLKKQKNDFEKFVLFIYIFILVGFLVGSILVIIFYKQSIKISKFQDELQNYINLLNKHVLFTRTDLNGTIVDVSVAFCNLSGFKKNEIIGSNHNIFKNDDTQMEVYNDLWDSIKNKNKWSGEIKNSKKNGQEYWIYTDIATEYNEMGEKIGYISFKQDITDKKERALQEIHIMDSSKMVALGEMIGNIAHQWRQPLSAISVKSTGVMLQKEMGMLKDEVLLESLEEINTQVQYLSETIDTFRDFIKTDKLVKEVVIQERIDNALNIVKASLQSNFIEVKKEINYDDPIQIKVIVGELPQVLINIINNAKDILIEKQIKEPWIKVSVKKKLDSVKISIEDNAGGVPDEILPKIFEPYFTTKHQSKGTGLGLYMSYKIIVQSLNGELHVKNTENGAKFTITLPLNN